MTTTSNYRNRAGQDIHVGDVVDILTFGVEGVEGGTVVRLRVTRGAQRVRWATIRQASGREVDARVAHVVPR
jgi:hypothetical protein